MKISKGKIEFYSWDLVMLKRVNEEDARIYCEIKPETYILFNQKQTIFDNRVIRCGI